MVIADARPIAKRLSATFLTVTSSFLRRAVPDDCGKVIVGVRGLAPPLQARTTQFHAEKWLSDIDTAIRTADRTPHSVKHISPLPLSQAWLHARIAKSPCGNSSTLHFRYRKISHMLLQYAFRFCRSSGHGHSFRCCGARRVA